MRSYLKLLLAIGLISLVLCSSCTHTKYKFIKPELPTLVKLERPELHKIEAELVGELYCLTYVECLGLQQNEVMLQNLIEQYEMQIEEYNEFVEEYSQEKGE